MQAGMDPISKKGFNKRLTMPFRFSVCGISFYQFFAGYINRQLGSGQRQSLRLGENWYRQRCMALSPIASIGSTRK